jgi:hypothetical protein
VKGLPEGVRYFANDLRAFHQMIELSVSIE